MSDLHIIAPGPLTTIQDLGRPGYAQLGVPLSGAADRGALKLANRLVGNDIGAAGLEITLGGLRIRVGRQIVIAATGAPADIAIGGRISGHHAATVVEAGTEIEIPPPITGLRTYLAVRGGIEVEPVLGSRSTDRLSGLGPPPLRAGDELPVGTLTGPWPPVTDAPWEIPDPDAPVILHASPGPRVDHVSNVDALYSGGWTVNPESDRIGVRLDGDRQLRHRTGRGELASEPVALGSVQLPPSGQPVLFLSDHPTTGGYPVIAVLTADSTDLAAQLTARQQVRFKRD